VRFYSQLAPELTGVPKCHGAAFDAWTGRYLLVLEDLPASCEFRDTLHPPSIDQASVTSLLTGSLMNTSIKALAGRTDIPIETGRFIADNYRAVAAVIDTPPHTVMHGDAHPGNMYFRDGNAGLLDRQAARRGHPSPGTG
jgi:hypothetical protein